MSAPETTSAAETRTRRARALRLRIRNPPAHWRLLTLCLVMVAVLIAFQGFCTHTIGDTGEPTGSPGATAPLAGSRPLLVRAGDGLRSPQPPPGKRIALTFDDGPDATWTPKVARVLREHGVPGTFFMVGSQAAHHPDIVRAVERSGGEIADHTFTHASLSSGAQWQRRLPGMRPRDVEPSASSHSCSTIAPVLMMQPSPMTGASVMIDSRRVRRRRCGRALRWGRRTPPGERRR